jgi:hypothetical protein
MSMAEDDFTAAKPFGRDWRKRRAGKVMIDIGPTQDAERRQLPVHSDAEHADRFPALYPQEIDHDCRNVRLDITFDEPIRIRDQAEMIKAAMEEIIGLTKKHDLGSIQQRRLARYTAAVCGRALSRFNGKTPYGDSKPKRK